SVAARTRGGPLNAGVMANARSQGAMNAATITPNRGRLSSPGPMILRRKLMQRAEAGAVPTGAVWLSRPSGGERHDGHFAGLDREGHERRTPRGAPDG